MNGPCDESCIALTHECKRDHGTLAVKSDRVLASMRSPKNGRPKGSSNLKAKQPSAIALAFMKAGLDWRIDFAEAIKANKRDRIKLWLRLLPYMITTGSRVKVKNWKGRASKAAIIALDAMEQSTND